MAVFTSLLTKMRKASSILRALCVSVTSQIVSSATNFFLSMYLVRTIPREEFGVYTMGFAALLLIAGLVSAAIGVQFVVNLPRQTTNQRDAYAVHHVVAIGVLGLLVAVCGAALTFIPWSLQIGGAPISDIAFPAALGAAAYALRDILVRVAFSERREFAVLFSSLGTTLGTVLVLGSLWWLAIAPSAFNGLLAYGVGQLLGAVMAAVLLRLPWHRLEIGGLREAYRDSWHGGRWHLLTGVAYSMRTQAHNLVVAPMLGVAAIADMNAARILVTPAVMAIPPITQVFQPRLAESCARGLAALLQMTAFVGVTLLSIALLYASMLLLLLPWLLPLVLGNGYQHVGGLVVAWCVVVVLLALRNAVAIALQAVRAFRPLLFANTAASMFALMATLMMGRLFGAEGAVAGLASAEALLSVTLIIVLKRFIRSEPEGALILKNTPVS